MEEYIEKNKNGYFTDNENELRMAICKDYLKNTDYAIIKMYETVVQGGSILEMLKEYKEVLSKRKDARALINELEKGMENGE